MTCERAAEVVLAGELDISSYDAAQEQVTNAERTTPAVLIIDLAGLHFVDSTGVRLILEADQRARDEGRRLTLRLGNGIAHRVFALLGLLDRFDVLDAAPEASP